MKKVALILFVLMSYSSTYGLDLNNLIGKLIDKDSISFENTKAIVESKNFYFLAQWKQPGMSTRETTGNIRNYISVSDESVRCQLQYYNFKSLSDKGSNSAIITDFDGNLAIPEDIDFIFDGEVSKYKVITDEKKKTINVSYFIKFRANIYEVEMLILSNGDTKVTLTPIRDSVGMTYQGKIG